ncbi:MAG: hypothetical protein ACPGTS_02090 [Minisyncoccia bacterium]
MKKQQKTADDISLTERQKRGGSVDQMTPPHIPVKSHRDHGELCGIGCFITSYEYKSNNKDATKRNRK